MNNVVFVDCETTGLDPRRHEIWEVAAITRVAGVDTEYLWHLPIHQDRADLIALNIGGWHARHRPNNAWIDGAAIGGTNASRFAEEFRKLTWGAHLVGAVPSFDAAFLTGLLLGQGEIPGWHYHLIDVEPLAVGYAIGRCRGVTLDGDIVKYPGIVSSDKAARDLPWRSEDLSRAVGVNPDRFDRHTAMGDAQWARAIYDAVMGLRATEALPS